MTNELRIIGLVAALAIVSGSGCTTPENNEENESTTEALTSGLANMNGFSGLAQVDEFTYLAVHDELVYEDGIRLTLVRLEDDATPTFSAVVVDNWVDSEGPSSDLESICAVPSRPNQFILAEAGYWQEEYGRLFHIELGAEQDSARVLGAFKLPLFADNNPDQEGDQFEGLACVDAGEDSVLLILGERGGSETYVSGLLRWGTLDLTDYALTFTADGEQGVELNAPGNWLDGTQNRDISALHLDSEGILWASASEDPGDLGPFYSVVFRVGTISLDLGIPIQVDDALEVWKEVSGFKIEALSGPSAIVAGSTLSFGTEDELYGGALRFL